MSGQVRYSCSLRYIAAPLTRSRYQSRPWVGLPLALIVALCGCALNPTTPEIATSTKTVTAQIAVSVPCFDPKDVPKLPEPTPIDLATAGPAQKAAAVDADVKALVRYATLVDQLFLQCLKSGATP